MRYLTKAIKIDTLEYVISKLEHELLMYSDINYNGTCNYATNYFDVIGLNIDDSSMYRAQDWFDSLRPDNSRERIKYYNYWLNKRTDSAYWFATTIKGNKQRIRYFNMIIKQLKS